MMKIRLGVNIDHVATVRNARGEIYPSPLRAALIAQNSGADSVTIHLREDRRHIKDLDAKKIIIEPILGLIDDSDDNFNGKITPEKNGEPKSCM